MPYVPLGLLTALWWVFTSSGWSKIRSPAGQRAFADSLRPLPLLPARLVSPVALLVTATELGLVLGTGWSMVALTAGWPVARPVAALVLAAALLLLTVLTAGVVLAVHHDTGARCACFGATPQPLGWRHVTRNTILLAMTIAAGVTVAVTRPHPLPPAGALISVAAGWTSALILVRLDDLVDLFRQTPAPGRTPSTRHRP
ncbi:MauE/DoxX family redox-associated membrane protein [Micromonospora humi]|uniref:Methylamine utilisation protein MauE n=1 Tax=Micromonospora humi TaxID=745366 RepID=A0A1C5K3Y3_9ACTN|nr:MauE/DoxX family redox-associated membrane protein [Micromonospora humi]SCG77504.1 Methylamine utilisation protein MauE [Micromonospora humi]